MPIYRPIYIILFVIMTLNEKELQALGLTNHNAINEKLYLGSVNQEKLQATKRNSKGRATFHQITQQGRKLKAWSKWVVVTHVEVDEKTGKKSGVVCFHRVFNMDDVDTSTSHATERTTNWARLITEKQKNLLMKLIHVKYADQPDTNRSLVAKLDALPASKASELIGKFLQTAEVES